MLVMQKASLQLLSRGLLQDMPDLQYVPQLYNKVQILQRNDVS
jgi:hypothetical protein